MIIHDSKTAKSNGVHLSFSAHVLPFFSFNVEFAARHFSPQFYFSLKGFAPHKVEISNFVTWESKHRNFFFFFWKSQIPFFTKEPKSAHPDIFPDLYSPLDSPIRDKNIKRCLFTFFFNHLLSDFCPGRFVQFVDGRADRAKIFFWDTANFEQSVQQFSMVHFHHEGTQFQTWKTDIERMDEMTRFNCKFERTICVNALIRWANNSGHVTRIAENPGFPKHRRIKNPHFIRLLDFNL